MKSKSEAPDKLLQYMADTSQDGKIEIIRTDNAPELMGGEFDEICISRTASNASLRQQTRRSSME